MRRPIAPSCVADGSQGAGHTPCLPRLSVWTSGYTARVPVSSGAMTCACQEAPVRAGRAAWCATPECVLWHIASEDDPYGDQVRLRPRPGLVRALAEPESG